LVQELLKGKDTCRHMHGIAITCLSIQDKENGLKRNCRKLLSLSAKYSSALAD
jgi:hypothetical protein